MDAFIDCLPLTDPVTFYLSHLSCCVCEDSRFCEFMSTKEKFFNWPVISRQIFPLVHEPTQGNLQGNLFVEHKSVRAFFPAIHSLISWFCPLLCLLGVSKKT